MRLLLATIVLCLSFTAAESKPRRSTGVIPAISCDDRGCWGSVRQVAQRRAARAGRVRVAKVRRHRTIATYARQPVRGGKSLAGVVAPLAAKVQEIQAACGSTIVSAVRHTRVRGSGRISLHASGRAVDIAGNPACIYAQLQGWRGGYSTDYHRISPKHVHVSWGGSEDGKRFVHWKPNRRVRLAHAR